MRGLAERSYPLRQAQEGRQESLRAVFLHPGQLVVSGWPCLLTTILGTSVAVCLVDPVARVGGMNHYVLPHGSGHAADAARFGNVAMARLLEALEALGAHREHLQARIYGGMSGRPPEHGVWDLGASNVAIALSVLAAEGIPLVDRDVGGARGRKLVLDPVDGKTRVELL